MAGQAIKKPDHTIATDPRATWQRFEDMVRQAVKHKEPKTGGVANKREVVSGSNVPKPL